jgi:hypothetical protein
MPQCDCRFARGSVSRRPTCHPRCAAQPTPQSMGVRAHVCCAVACAHVHARACLRACMWRSSVADTAPPRPVARTGAVALAALSAAATRLRRCGSHFQRYIIAAAAGRRARLPRHAGAASRRGVSARNDHARLVPSAASRRVASRRVASLQSTCRAERAVAVCARYGPTRALTLVAVAHAMPCHACWNAGGAGTTGVRLCARWRF